MNNPPFGVGDASYQAAGGIDGLRRLVDDFYRLMDQLPEAAALRRMHPQRLDASRDKLACFLSGWLGGPRLFSEKYGAISIPAFHAQWPIDQATQAIDAPCGPVRGVTHAERRIIHGQAPWGIATEYKAAGPGLSTGTGGWVSRRYDQDAWHAPGATACVRRVGRSLRVVSTRAVIPSPARRGAARSAIAGIDVYHQPNEVLLKNLGRTICSVPNQHPRSTPK
jgi:hypothetical protein